MVLFYFAAVKLLGVEVPIDFSYPPLLGTTMPCLFPLTIAATAAILEEFVFRMFAITFFKKIFKSTWLAVLLPAVLWAMGHTDSLISPPYSRAVELTVVGVVLGYVYLKYGIETTILAHYVYNAMVAGWPLLNSGNGYYKVSALIIILLAFLPGVIGIITAAPRPNPTDSGGRGS